MDSSHGAKISNLMSTRRALSNCPSACFRLFILYSMTTVFYVVIEKYNNSNNLFVCTACSNNKILSCSDFFNETFTLSAVSQIIDQTHSPR